MPHGGRVIGAALVLLCSVATAAEAAEGGPERSAPVKPALSIRYDAGLLSLRADGVPLLDVLEAIEAETGVHFDGEPLDRRMVWKRFEDVPLVEGLRRVIGRQNFTLTYGDDGAPLRVALLGPPQQPPAKPTRAATRSFHSLWRHEPPVPVSARLAAALRSTGPVWLAQLPGGLGASDPAVRRDAVDAFLRALRRNPTLRASFVGMSEARIGALAHAWAGPHAKDVLQTMAARSAYANVRAAAGRGLAHVPR